MPNSLCLRASVVDPTLCPGVSAVDSPNAAGLCVSCPKTGGEVYSGTVAASDARWDVLGVGANSVDFVYLLPGFPQLFGSVTKMQIRDRRVLCGGQSATAM